MDFINLDAVANELSVEDVNIGVAVLSDLQLTLVGGGIGDTQL